MILVRLIAFNAGTLEVSGEARAATENGSEQRIDASYRRLAGSPPTAADLAVPADPLWTPSLTGSDVVKLAR